MFLFGGLTTFENIASLHHYKWKDLGKKALRWPIKVTLNEFQIKKLSAIALWSAVKIFLGPLLNVSSLSRDDVNDIANQEICDDDGDEDVPVPTLSKIKDFPQYKKRMILCQKKSPGLCQSMTLLLPISEIISWYIML